MKPPIFTLTGNLLWEKTLTFSDWAPGRTQRATTESFQVGGKGINVARMLVRLGAPVTALCFPGGTTGAECTTWLRAKKIPFRAFRTAAPTRTGLVVRGGRHRETTFFSPDQPPSAAVLRDCASFLDARARRSALAICGSFPGWATTATAPLRTTLDRWLARGSFLAADTYGPSLAWLATRPLDLVKINRAEFDALFPVTARRDSIAARLHHACKRWPVRRWIITDGPRPVWFVERDSAEPASLAPPRVHEVSATGAGDVLLAGVLPALLQRDATLAEAVASALPYAAASAAHPGMTEFTANKFVKLRS
ncbi:MAG TPA: PfkB family carbohydrate kinase [Opitutaceae bacterium]|jgi:1-phosphofructokinase|nr:PfkB family carbohydrate kinase [Opitutaceae bacterium]